MGNMTLQQPRTVLVTGGARGIGRAICAEFGRAGWRVGIHYRTRQEDAERTVAEVHRAGGEGLACQADLRQGSEVHGMIREVLTKWDRMDVLICNAGIAPGALLLRLSDKDWEEAIRTNLSGAFHCLQAVGTHMVARGEGAIVLIGSFAAAHGRTGQAAYAASKAGLIGLMRTAAVEWGDRNIRVNMILPGWHKTELSEAAMRREDVFSDHLVKTTPDVEDVARSVYHLALLPGVSGQIWNLDSRLL
jgi:3-oxoacyl-[acyl-carrier protein] reductase